MKIENLFPRVHCFRNNSRSAARGNIRLVENRLNARPAYRLNRVIKLSEKKPVDFAGRLLMQGNNSKCIADKDVFNIFQLRRIISQRSQIFKPSTILDMQLDSLSYISDVIRH